MFLKKVAELAVEESKKGTCDRLQVGAVIFDRMNKAILGKGHNRAPHNWYNKVASCDEGGHVLNNSGGCIRTVHAEMVALADALKNPIKSVRGFSLMTTHAPCYYCSKFLVELNIMELFYMKDYESKSSYGSGLVLLHEYHVKIQKVKVRNNVLE